MCAYKLVTVKFRWWGLQTKVESFIQKVQQGRPSFPVGRGSRLKLLLRFYSRQLHLFFSFLFLFFNPPLVAREAHFHKLPPPALLLDRQMGGPDHGGHPADGGGDPERARGGNLQPLNIPAFLSRRERWSVAASPASSPGGGERGTGAECLITDVPMNLHIRCVRRETCEGPRRQTSRGRRRCRSGSG